MFYSELIEILRSDTKVSDTVSTFVEQSEIIPAIFSDYAPESAELPYIVVKIGGSKQPDNVITLATVTIDYWNYDQSRQKSDEFSIAIEDLLDLKCINAENFTDIRFNITNSDYIDQSDPRSIHFNTMFTARCSRSGWMKRNLP